MPAGKTGKHVQLSAKTTGVIVKGNCSVTGDERGGKGRGGRSRRTKWLILPLEFPEFIRRSEVYGAADASTTIGDVAARYNLSSEITKRGRLRQVREHAYTLEYFGGHLLFPRLAILLGARLGPHWLPDLSLSRVYDRTK